MTTRRGFLKTVAIALLGVLLPVRLLGRAKRKPDTHSLITGGGGFWWTGDDAGLPIDLPDLKVIAVPERCRLLKDIGIVVNREEAYDNLARSLDLEGSSQLTQEQRNVAILNAVIEKGREYL